MTRNDVLLVGAFEHPMRRAEDGHTVLDILGDVVAGALGDAGLEPDQVDAFFCDATMGGNPLVACDYLGLGRLRYFDSTDAGGASYLVHVGHAAAAIRAGACDVAVVAMAGIARASRPSPPPEPFDRFERRLGVTQPALYALAASRYMHQYGLTSAQLAEVRVAASFHASFNPRARFRDPVTVDDVLASPLIADPLRRLDCCVTTDGGGALVLASARHVKDRGRAGVVAGFGSSVGHARNGTDPVGPTAGTVSGPMALGEAGISPGDVRYASIYDSFTFTVVQTLEDLGFCQPGQAGHFVGDGRITAPHGVLPINTDGGGLCNNHPGRRGGMPRIIEAVRQLRGEAHAGVQVPDCTTVLVHGTGGAISTRHGSATLVLRQAE